MSRAYKIEDVSYPSVTTITGQLDKSAGLVQWAANSAVEYVKLQVAGDGQYVDDRTVEEICDKARFEWRSISKEAMDIGSEVHRLIEKYIKDGKDAVGSLRPEVENGFLAFLEWESENVSKWVKSEFTVCSKEHGFAGTLDAVCRYRDKGLYVIDFKSSKDFYDEMPLQVAGYRCAYEEMSGKKIDGMGTLRLDKESGIPEFKDYSEKYEEMRASFLYLLRFYYSFKTRRLKNNPWVKK